MARADMRHSEDKRANGGRFPGGWCRAEMHNRSTSPALPTSQRRLAGQKTGISFLTATKVENNVGAEDSAPDDLLPDYEFDHRKARPNRFAARAEKKTLTVVLDADVAEVFTTTEAVNTALRALIEASGALALDFGVP